MAVVAVKSGWMTSAESTPPLMTNPAIHKGNLKSSVGKVAVANGDSIGSTFRLCRIPSNARISNVLLTCGAITSAAADIGLYKTTRDGGAVVDADFFASAQSLAAALARTSVVRESGVVTPANVEKMVWEQLGLTQDPGIEYDVVATLTAAATAAESMALEVQYAV